MAAVVCWGAPARAAPRAPARAQAPPPAPFYTLGEEIVATVRDHFHDATRAQSWARSHRGYGAAAPDWPAFVASTRAILAELATSHTAFYPRGGREHPMLSAIFADGLGTRPVHVSVGADLAATADGLFVRRLFPGGPAEAAGLLRGDRVVAVDGRAPPDPALPLIAAAGRPVRLTVQRAPGGPPLELRVAPVSVGPRQEWLAMQRAGSTILERAGVRIGYHPMFSCAGADHEAALRDALGGALAGAAALVLELRDGWGGCRPELVELFSPVAPVVTSISRGGRRSTSSSAWRRPVVVLVNGGTRSGKEVVSFVLKKHRLATLVGERTAGAVMTGKVFPLGDGSLLYLAVAEVLVDGQRLEGSGVAPDVVVPDALAFAQGKDPQLERALAVAADEVTRRGRPGDGRRPQ